MAQTVSEKFGRHVAWTSDEPIGLEVAFAEGPYIYLNDGRRIIDVSDEEVSRLEIAVQNSSTMRVLHG